MKTFNDMLYAVIDFLRTDESCAGYRLIRAYPDMTVQNPVERQLVSVGLSSLKIAQATPGAVIGHQDQIDQIGRQAEWDLCIRIYVPRYAAGPSCYDVFSDIAAALLERQSDWKIGEVDCGELTYERDTRTFVLECHVGLITLLQLER